MGGITGWIEDKDIFSLRHPPSYRNDYGATGGGAKMNENEIGNIVVH
jgi:hypothetical protein